MKALRTAAWVVAFTVCPLAAQVPQGRTTSTSGQFSIFGGSAPQRLAVARRADEIREGWLTATGLPSGWKWPIIIELSAKTPPNRPAPIVSLFVGDGDTLK
ncbi:MAG: hypothetical protein N2322_07340, partial [Terrimicrobiaceae bacterium]|nr:hypothetical protein [Terrimicrobiaceae bacterium]